MMRKPAGHHTGRQSDLARFRLEHVGLLLNRASDNALSAESGAPAVP